MQGLKILGTGHYLPEKILTNYDLEKIVDTNDEWITTRTGIKQRHILDDKNQSSSDMGYQAALSALSMSNLNPQDIDMILVGTSTPDMGAFPATANIIQHKLGCKNQAPSFDFQIACSSFTYGLILASQFIQTGSMKNILLICTDVMSRIVDYKDRNTCILFGDGASAVVLGHSEENHLLGYNFGSDGSFPLEFLSVPIGGSLQPLKEENVNNNKRFIQMVGSEVYRLAIKYMSSSFLGALENADLSIEDLNYLIPHQANYRIMEGVAKKLKLPANKIISTVHEHANTSGSTIGIALDIAVRSNKIQRGDILGLTAFGAGLSWGSNIIKF